MSTSRSVMIGCLSGFVSSLIVQWSVVAGAVLCVVVVLAAVVLSWQNRRGQEALYNAVTGKRLSRKDERETLERMKGKG